MIPNVFPSVSSTSRFWTCRTERAAILGMSSLADTDIQLVLDGHGAETAGYLTLPGP